MSKKTTYTTEQLIHSYRNAGYSLGAIAKAINVPKPTIQAVLRREPTPLQEAEIVGDGCSYMTEGGSMNQDPNILTPLDIEEMDLEVSQHPHGQLDHIESGYPDIYYNERSKQYDVYLHGRKVWRASKLTDACKVRLSKGSLSENDTQLLDSVVSASPEIQAALNEIPM